jgi:hypothetical protein
MNRYHTKHGRFSDSTFGIVISLTFRRNYVLETRNQNSNNGYLLGVMRASFRAIIPSQYVLVVILSTVY